MVRSQLVIFLGCIFTAQTVKPEHHRGCGPLERPVHGHPRPDKFCKPHLTRTLLLDHKRRCVCRWGFVRNAWGDCIPIAKCKSCIGRHLQDFNSCKPACSLACNRPFSLSCIGQCAPGCDCPPGFVLNLQQRHSCISSAKCPPKCPKHSVYRLCVSSCQRWCHKRPHKHCRVTCLRGDCVCRPGYAKVIDHGHTMCVPMNLCPRFKE